MCAHACVGHFGKTFICTCLTRTQCRRCPVYITRASCLDDNLAAWVKEKTIDKVSSGLGGGAMAGAVIGGIVGAGLLYMAGFLSGRSSRSAVHRGQGGSKALGTGEVEEGGARGAL